MQIFANNLDICKLFVNNTEREFDIMTIILLLNNKTITNINFIVLTIAFKGVFIVNTNYPALIDQLYCCNIELLFSC